MALQLLFNLCALQVRTSSCVIILTLLCAGYEHCYLRRGAANVVFELIWAAEPSSPVLEELLRRGNEERYYQRQLCCIPDTDPESETDLDNDIHLEEILMVLHTQLQCI